MTAVNLERFRIFSHLTYFPNGLRITLMAITMLLFLPSLAFDIWFYFVFARNAMTVPLPEGRTFYALMALVIPLGWCVLLDCALAAVSLKIVVGVRERLKSDFRSYPHSGYLSDDEGGTGERGSK
ncbi:hypothetical protein HK097_002744, partial [Rhizophlyctis rosea]